MGAEAQAISYRLMSCADLTTEADRRYCFRSGSLFPAALAPNQEKEVTLTSRLLKLFPVLINRQTIRFSLTAVGISVEQVNLGREKTEDISTAISAKTQRRMDGHHGFGRRGGWGGAGMTAVGYMVPLSGDEDEMTAVTGAQLHKYTKPTELHTLTGRTVLYVRCDESYLNIGVHKCKGNV